MQPRVAGIVALTLVLGGCLGENGNSPPVLGEPDTYWEIEVLTTSVRRSEATGADAAAQLPPGAPAAGLVLKVRYSETPPVDETWMGDVPCPPFLGPESYVSAVCTNVTRNGPWILPSSLPYGFVIYPLDDDGRTTLLLPRDRQITLGISGALGSELRGKADDPNGCETVYSGEAGSLQWPTWGKVEKSPQGVHVSGPGRVDVLWITGCAD